MAEVNVPMDYKNYLVRYWIKPSNITDTSQIALNQSLCNCSHLSALWCGRAAPHHFKDTSRQNQPFLPYLLRVCHLFPKVFTGLSWSMASACLQQGWSFSHQSQKLLVKLEKESPLRSGSLDFRQEPCIHLLSPSGRLRFDSPCFVVFQWFTPSNIIHICTKVIYSSPRSTSVRYLYGSINHLESAASSGSWRVDFWYWMLDH